MRYVSTHQVIEQDEVHGDDGDQALDLEKKKEKNKKAQGKGILDRSFFVLALKTPSGCEYV
jgi:hypothetical protein